MAAAASAMRPVMPPSPFAYSSPYNYFPALDTFPQDYSMDHNIHHQQSMQPPPSPQIPIDPALALYPPYYSNYNHPAHHIPQHLALPPNYSSPSSQGSDTIGTPPTEHMYPSSSANTNGKRPSVNNSADPRKKQRKDEDDNVPSPAADKEEVKAKPTRGSRACTVCRRLKMKCVGAEQGPPCKRCLAGNHECIFEESNRGKRSSKKHEILTRSLRKMERTLDTVLRSIGNPSIASGMISRSPSPSAQTAGTQALLDNSPSPQPSASASVSASTSTFKPQQQQKTHVPGSPKLHSLPDNALNPLGLLVEASLANRRAQATNPGAIARQSTGDNPKVGVASDNYFKPGPMTILPLRRLYIERQIQPEMLSFVTKEEVVALFNIYFDHIHMHCNLLDRNFHTPSLVCSRSPFLLTTICSIASKFYTEKPDLHPRLTELAKRLAFSVPAKGYKSVEIVQAYLLLALWGCGAVERYEQDKTWLLLGMAIRMATDLNLHRRTAVTSQDTQEGKARDLEVHNRERTWILCFCLDRSFSAQMGKPSSVKEDHIIRNTTEWYHSPYANSSDVSLAAYTELQRILSRSLEFLYSATDTPSGLQVNCDYLIIIKTFETQIMAWKQQWIDNRNWGEDSPTMTYKRLISNFYFNYAMLVLNSFGLQNALERTPLDIGHFFGRVHQSAVACATIVRDELGPAGYMRFSPDSHFVQTSYAVLSLLKLVRPEFQAFLDNEQSTLGLVRDVADVLDSIAANPLHTPALYSGFLRALIAAKLEPGSHHHSASSSAAGGDDIKGHHMMLSDGADGNNNGNGIGVDEMQMPGGGYGGGYGGGGMHHSHMYHQEPAFLLNEFQFDSEMGPAMASADLSTFPPTMSSSEDSSNHINSSSNSNLNGAGLGMGGLGGVLTMESIMSSGFWDSMLVPGYNAMDGLAGGFVFGAGGSGLITPRFGGSPMGSGANTPGRMGLGGSLGGALGSGGMGGLGGMGALTQGRIDAAFGDGRKEVKIDS